MTRGYPPAWGLHGRVATSQLKKMAFYKILNRASDLDEFFGITYVTLC
jgi:hypothetical protein